MTRRSTRPAAEPVRVGLLARRAGPLRVLCLGAHADDIEIGCGGTVLALLAARPVECRWVVFSGTGPRASEARRSAARFLRRARRRDVQVLDFRDGFFPHQGAALKEHFEGLKAEPSPDLIFTHYRADRHQDHRTVAELTWNTFREHLILEYEIPKYDADLGAPNCYVPLAAAVCRAKIQGLVRGFPSQRTKRWFTRDTFHGLLRLRGIECGAREGLAEAFHAPKILVRP